MKRTLALLPAVLLSLGSLACSEPEVIAEAVITEEGANQTVPLAELPVRLLPYDRDAIFDSLTAAASEPEPPIPAEIQQQQQQVQQAQEQWQQAQERWGTVRDSLRTLSESLQRMQQQNLRATPQYRQAFEQFNRLEAEERGVKQAMDQAFARFDQLQRSTLTQIDSIRTVREIWAERAFEDFDQIVAARLEASGREELVDTTNAQGVATFRAPEGRWWVYSRYTLPYEELYWNIPIEVTGDSTHIQITDQNAERRPLM